MISEHHLCPHCYDGLVNGRCLGCEAFSHIVKTAGATTTDWFSSIQGATCKICGTEKVAIWRKPISSSRCENGHIFHFQSASGAIMSSSVNGFTIEPGTLEIDRSIEFSDLSTLSTFLALKERLEDAQKVS